MRLSKAVEAALLAAGGWPEADLTLRALDGPMKKQLLALGRRMQHAPQSQEHAMILAIAFLERVTQEQQRAAETGLEMPALHQVVALVRRHAKERQPQAATGAGASDPGESSMRGVV